MLLENLVTACGRANARLRIFGHEGVQQEPSYESVCFRAAPATPATTEVGAHRPSVVTTVSFDRVAQIEIVLQRNLMAQVIGQFASQPTEVVLISG
jgi:hypothetical protein